MTITAGVDPGLSGALAIADFSSGSLIVHDMPTLNIKVGGSNRRRLDLTRLCDICLQLQLFGVELVCVEDVWGFPGQGATAAFWLGHSVGAANTAIAAARVPMMPVQPKLWKKVLGIPSDKDSARRKAMQLWPRHTEIFERQKDDGRAEAALIAAFAAQHLKRMR